MVPVICRSGIPILIILFSLLVTSSLYSQQNLPYSAYNQQYSSYTINPDSVFIREVGSLFFKPKLDSRYLFDNYALFVSPTGIMTFDVSDSCNPVLIDTAPIDGNSLYTQFEGRFLYTLSVSGNFSVFDLKDPGNIILISNVDFQPYGLMPTRAGLLLDGDLLYFTSRNYQVVIIDVRVPTSPNIRGITFLPDPKRNFFDCTEMSLTDKFLVLSGRGEGVKIIDVRNPDLPVVYVNLDIYHEDEYFSFLYSGLTGNIVAAAGYDIQRRLHFLKLFDISDPDNPAAVWGITRDFPWGGMFYENCLRVQENYVRYFDITFDITDPASPDSIGTAEDWPFEEDEEINWDMSLFDPYISSDYSRTIRASDEYLFIQQRSNITVFDLKDFGNPRQIGTHFVYSRSRSFDVTDNLIITDEIQYGENQKLRIFDYSDLNNIEPVSSMELGDQVSIARLKHCDGFVFVTDQMNRKLHVINIADPYNPSVTGVINGEFQSITIKNGYLYLASPETGLTIFSISPEAIGNTVYQDSGPDHIAQSMIYIEDNMLYSVLNENHRYYSLSLYNIENPSDIKRVSSLGDIDLLNYSGGIGSIDMINDYIVFNSHDKGKLCIINVADPLNLFKAGEYSHNCSYRMEVQDERIYLNNFGTLWVLELTGTDPGSHLPEPLVPENYTLHQNYPNPFNPLTTITFELKQSENVKLDIYNTLGQRIRSLVDRSIPSGRHMVRWDGTNDAGIPVAGGVYICRMIAGSKVKSRRLLMLR